MSNEITINDFDYKQLDQSTAEFLRHKENNMREIFSNTCTKLGKELKEAQEKLASNYRGVFEEWYTSLGFKRQTVYNLINRYELVLQNPENTNLIEELPKSLVYEIAKPSANPELRQKVVDGDIRTHKEFKELERKQKEAEQKAKELEAESEQYRHQCDLLLDENKTLKKKEPTVVEKIVEKTVIPSDYNSLKEKATTLQQSLANTSLKAKRLEEDKQLLEKKIDLNKREVEEYNNLKKQISELKNTQNDLYRQIESATSISEFIIEVENMLRTKLAPVKYSRAISEQKTDSVVIANLESIVERIDEWLIEIKSLLPCNENYIDINVKEENYE